MNLIPKAAAAVFAYEAVACATGRVPTLSALVRPHRLAKVALHLALAVHLAHRAAREVQKAAEEATA